MIASPNSRATAPVEAPESSVFTRVVVAVDGSPEGIEAARQAASLLDPKGRLMLVSAYDIATAVVGGGGLFAPMYGNEPSLVQQADEALEAARTAIPQSIRASTRRLRGGRPWEELLREANREHASAIAVGTHATGRLRGIVVGSTATELIHKATCSVLIARADVASPPATVVVGVDGSPESGRLFRSPGAFARASARACGRLWLTAGMGWTSTPSRRYSRVSRSSSCKTSR